MSVKKVLESLDSNSTSKKHLLVLDIDSTLVTTFQRNQAILDEFCKQQSQLFPEECNKLKMAQCRLGDYGYKTSLNRLNTPPLSNEFLDQLDIFWRKNFFSNDFLHSDQPTEGAIEFVQHLEKTQVPFVYLTGRHKNTMWPGTLKSLKQLGFPITEDQLILKENLDMKDELYKSAAIEALKQNFKDHSLWLIDNEPVILNQIEKDHADVKLVWFESCHSGKMQPPASALKINHFIFSK